MLWIILPNSLQDYTKSATTNFEHGFDPPLNNVKKNRQFGTVGHPLGQTYRINLFFVAPSNGIYMKHRFPQKEICASFNWNKLYYQFDCYRRNQTSKVLPDVNHRIESLFEINANLDPKYICAQ